MRFFEINRSYKVQIYYVVQPIGRLPKRRCQGRTADALAQEADEGRGKLR